MKLVDGGYESCYELVQLRTRLGIDTLAAGRQGADTPHAATVVSVNIQAFFHSLFQRVSSRRHSFSFDVLWESSSRDSLSVLVAPTWVLTPSILHRGRRDQERNRTRGTNTIINVSPVFRKVSYRQFITIKGRSLLVSTTCQHTTSQSLRSKLQGNVVERVQTCPQGRRGRGGGEEGVSDGGRK